MAKNTAEQKFSYDDAVQQIEEIVNRLEQNGQQVSFDNMIADVEKAMQLIDLCKKNIASAEDKLKQLTANNN